MTPEERKIDDLLVDLVNMTQTDEYPGERQDRIKTAKASLLQMLVEARIDELRKISIHKPVLDREERIKELSAQLNPKEEES